MKYLKPFIVLLCLILTQKTFTQEEKEINDINNFFLSIGGNLDLLNSNQRINGLYSDINFYNPFMYKTENRNWFNEIGLEIEVSRNRPILLSDTTKNIQETFNTLTTDSLYTIKTSYDLIENIEHNNFDISFSPIIKMHKSFLIKIYLGYSKNISESTTEYKLNSIDTVSNITIPQRNVIRHYSNGTEKAIYNYYRLGFGPNFIYKFGDRQYIKSDFLIGIGREQRIKSNYGFYKCKAEFINSNIGFKIGVNVTGHFSRSTSTRRQDADKTTGTFLHEPYVNIYVAKMITLSTISNTLFK